MKGENDEKRHGTIFYTHVSARAIGLRKHVDVRGTAAALNASA
jgi:hypothetical protein